MKMKRTIRIRTLLVGIVIFWTFPSLLSAWVIPTNTQRSADATTVVVRGRNSNLALANKRRHDHSSYSINDDDETTPMDDENDPKTFSTLEIRQPLPLDFLFNRRQAMIRSTAATTTTAVSLLLVSIMSLSFPKAAYGRDEETRCDASDRRCGPDGKLRDDIPTGKPIPKVTNRITHVVQMIIYVGERREETGAVRFGLYGDDCPNATRQMLEFLTPRGISTNVPNENAMGIKTSSVSLLDGGIVPNICSGTAVEFGIPSQAKAYASSRGLVKAGVNFVPQTRPASGPYESEPFPRQHDVAGLVSIPIKGIGYGGGGGNDLMLLPDDEAFESAFLITADAAPALNKDRRVIGQVIDDESMVFLERLAKLPTQKGIKGIIPGQTSGPPLLKVTIRDIGIQKVGTSSSSSSTKRKK